MSFSHEASCLLRDDACAATYRLNQASGIVLPWVNLTAPHLRFLVCALLLAAAPWSNAAELKAGVGKVDITDRAAGPVNDPSFARALVLKSGDATGVIEVKSFVDMFSGTPVQMQFVRFQTTATTIGGAGGRGQRYYDFLDPAEVTSAKSELDKLVSNGGTNWEDAWFQMFYDTNGKLEQVTPDLVLFFTDGVATLGRNLGNGYSSSAVSWNPPAAVSGAPKSTGNTFYWEGWYRTDLIADTFGATTRYIGVGVGPDVATGKKSSWWTGGNTSVQVENGSTIARLITADDNGTGVPATKGPAGTYDNAAVANMYLLPAWSQFADALKAVALAECGGTVTVQTQVDGVPAGDPVTYVRSNVTDALGKAVDVPLVSITTDQSSISATVDFSIPSGQYVTASIVPQNTGQLGAYTPVGWSCTSGGAAKSTTSVAIDGSTWQGVRLKVGANEAVSCILDLDLVTPP